MNAWAPSRYSTLLHTPSTYHRHDYRHDYTSTQLERIDRYDNSTMPRPQSTKVKDEHLIFVKNVPADLATGALQDVFARYEPVRVKNVYPSSDITTVVLSFKTFSEASYAQEDTDGMRLENVVLRVEMFSKHRSVRYLREGRNAHRPLGAVDEEYEEEVDEQPGYIPDPADLPPLDISRASTPFEKAGTTWAQVARKPQSLGTTPLPAPVPFPPLHLFVADEASIPKLTFAVPRIPPAPDTIDATSQSTDIDDDSLRSPVTSYVEVASYEGDIEDSPKMNEASMSPEKDILSVSLEKKTAPLSRIMIPWEPIDSTEKLRQRHCRGCVFCRIQEDLARRLKAREY